MDENATNPKSLSASDKDASVSSSSDAGTEASETYFSLIIEHDFDIVVAFDALVIFFFLALLVAILIWRYFKTHNVFGALEKYEIDAAEFGIGPQKVILRPNETDRQIAYQIWVELSTRKIGLEIDLENDVIDQVYDSWYSFFAVTRELIKAVPVSKFRRKDTEKIIKLSIEVLNHGIRPHLTMWQARYRRWYDKALERAENDSLSPQDIQKQYPEFDALMQDLLEVNGKLILYRDKMYNIVTRL